MLFQNCNEVNEEIGRLEVEIERLQNRLKVRSFVIDVGALEIQKIGEELDYLIAQWLSLQLTKQRQFN